MIQIGIIANTYEKAKQRNVLGGIVISDLIAFIAYVIFFSGFFWFGDFQMVLGVAIGTRFALKHMKEFQSPLKLGLTVALGGSILSAVSMFIFTWVIYFFNPALLDFFFLYILEALIIGLFLGIILGLYYRSKYNNDVNKGKHKYDELFDSLKTSK